jgi:type I restriction enzyme S subunit
MGDLALPSEQRDPRENPTEEFSYVDIASVDNAAKAIVAPKRMVGADAPSRARKVIRKGDVIVSTVRPNLNAVALVPSSLDNQICSTGFSVLRPSSKVISGYLFAFARSPSFIDFLVGRTTGANYPAVNDGEVKDVPVPVPPLAEQERLVRILDEADALRKLRAQADQRTAPLVPALFDEMFGDPLTNNHGLPTAELGEIASVERGRFSPRPRNDPSYYGGDYPFIQTGDIAESGGHVTTWKQTLNERGKKVSKEFPAGTIVIAIVGATIGQTAILGLPVFAPDSVVGVRPNPMQAVNEYVIAVLQRWRPVFLAQAPETARANLNAATLKGIRIPVPPLPLQREFAARVAEVRAMEAVQAESRQRLDALFQSLLHRAFAGEL